MRAGINEFYENANILVTGGTGFIGKVLIEKLLRSQCNIKKLYILIRSKHGKLVDERIENEMFGQPIFDYLKKHNPNFMDKVQIVEGDITKPQWGLQDSELDLIIKETNIVFNVAASINMGTTLKHNVKCNVYSVLELLKQCRKMKNLKSVVIVSTAYSNCNNKVIEEKIYKSPINANFALTLCKEVDDSMLINMTPHVLNDLPNTYVLSKCIMENALLDYEDLPIVVFRPSIVVSAYKEPLPGWTVPYNGPIITIYLALLGVYRTSYCDLKLRTSWVPVDFCVNALICSAWDGTRNRLEDKDQPMVYNFTCNDHQRSWQDYIDVLDNTTVKLERAAWFPLFTGTRFDFFRPILFYLVNIIPAMIMDIFLALSGNKFRLRRLYNEKIIPELRVFSYFTNREWTFKDDNVRNMLHNLSEEEKTSYPFDMSKVNFEELVTNYALGVKLYMAKDKPENNDKALRKHRWLKIIHYTFLTIVYSLAFWMLYKLTIIVFI